MLPHLATAATRQDPSRRPVLSRGNSLITGGAFEGDKAPGDSLLLMGPAVSGAPYIGNFQTPAGLQDWNGWTHHDYTAAAANHWHASGYMAEGLAGHGPGNQAAWCGEDLPACDPPDTAGGYGNNYNDTLAWTGTVADPGQLCTVTLDAFINYDVEPGYDFVYLAAFTAGNVRHDLLTFNGQAAGDTVHAVFTYLPGDYEGESGNGIRLAFIVASDGAWSDADCSWPTRGACQVDDIGVQADNGVAATFDDFQAGLGSWTADPSLGVGDFAQIWSGLEDVDPCRTNYSPQVAFIDDGKVVPGVGPTLCINWCYGPFGYIVNNTGGRLGPDHHLSNGIQSPVMAWPGAQYTGAQLDFTVYMHEDLSTNSAGMFPTWDMRSTSSADPADIELEPWLGRDFVYLGGPYYRRFQNDVSDLLAPGVTYVQVKLAVNELGYIWGWDGSDGTPAPYYDNVRLTAFEHNGPHMSVRDIDLAQDNFPASGILDEADLGTNSVRFDMARNIAPAAAMMNQPGDSLVVSISPVRNGAVLAGMPRMHYRVSANHLFDPWRTSGLPLDGFVEGDSVRVGGFALSGSFAFDLPDSGFLFPGDVVHYYFSATEDLGGDARTAILPADTTGFSDFAQDGIYDPRFIMRALPSMRSYDGSTIYYSDGLFWYDGGTAGLDEWLTSLREINLLDGASFDLYRTQGAASGVGNGLGGRATVDQIAPYDLLLYDSGDMTTHTLGVGDFDQDASRDVQLLESWLQLPYKGAYLAGGSLASDLLGQGSDGQAFLQERLGVTVVTSWIRQLIHNQTSPVVQTIPVNPLGSDHTMLIYGGCPNMPAMDAVEITGSAQQIAEYLDPNGDTGQYPYSAATMNVDAVSDSKVISTPFPFDRIWDTGTNGNPWSAERTWWLKDVIMALDWSWYYFPTGTDLPGAEALTAAAAPNPFNPRVEIKYQAPRAGELAVRIYDLQGRLVKELLRGHAEAGPGKVLWDGADQAGAPASSGIYFYEVRQGADRVRGKIALIR